MIKSKIVQEPQDVNSKLAELGLVKQDLIEVALQAIAAKNNATPLHPSNAGGLYAYLEGVTALRKVLLPKDGWTMEHSDGIEATVNNELGIKILYQNVDRACSIQPPKAISGKGDGAKKLLETNPTKYLFADMEQAHEMKKNQSVWFLCVSSREDEVHAELSIPASIEGRQFSEFYERIFIISDKDFEIKYEEDENENIEDIEIEITRK